MKTRNVQEGDWFSVPLKEGGYALGVVARKGKKGVLLGYFFGPIRSRLPALEAARALSADEAVLVEIFGDLYLRRQMWPVLGKLSSWDREKWPMPLFGRTDDMSGRAWKIVYSDDPSAAPTVIPCGPEEASRYRKDGLSGAGAVEVELTEILRDGTDPNDVGR